MASTGESPGPPPHRLVLTGRVDINQARALHEEARAALDRRRDILVDWRDAEMIDGSALQILLALRAAADAAGCGLRATPAPEAVARALSLAGLTHTFAEAP